MISFIINSKDLHLRLAVLLSFKLLGFDSGSYWRLCLGFHAYSCFSVHPVLPLKAQKVALFGIWSTQGNKGSLSSFTVALHHLNTFISLHTPTLFCFRTKIINKIWHVTVYDLGIWGETKLALKAHSQILWLYLWLGVCRSDSRGSQRKPFRVTYPTRGSTATTLMICTRCAWLWATFSFTHHAYPGTEGLAALCNTVSSWTLLLHILELRRQWGKTDARLTSG